MKKSLVIFLILNFTALAIGSIWTTPGVASDWYTGLNQAPWTPPGWVFGAAWTTIVLCFSVYMARVWHTVTYTYSVIVLYVVQWMLNIIWNPMFFVLQETLLAFVLISSLTVLMIGTLIRYRLNLGRWTMLVIPYIIWLMIATSLNGYIVFFN